MNRLFVEEAQIVTAFVPSNLAAGGVTGDVVSMKNFGRCSIVISKAVGAASQDPTITVLQGTDVAFATNKAITFTRLDMKKGSALTAVGQFTTTEQAAANTYTDTTLGENQALIVIDIKAEDLDVDGGYDCIRVSVSDPGTTAQYCSGLYVLREPRYESKALPSAIVD